MLRTSTIATIGYSFKHDGTTPDPANHQYALRDFYNAV
jgi:phospholipase C